MIPGDDEDAGRSFPLKKSGSDRIKDLSVFFCFFPVRIDYVDCKNKISCIYVQTHTELLGLVWGRGGVKFSIRGIYCGASDHHYHSANKLKLCLHIGIKVLKFTEGVCSKA